MPEQVPGRKTILVVDDAPENIRVLTATLGGGYAVKAATSGEKALAVCAADPVPDLVLLDLVMPGISGYEVCRRLKAEARTAGIPVILVTGQELETEGTHWRESGAVGVIRKPIDPAVVRERVAAAL